MSGGDRRLVSENTGMEFSEAAKRMRRKERIAIALGFLMPVLIVNTHQIWYANKVSTGAVAAALIAFSSLGGGVYLFFVNVQKELMSFLPQYSHEETETNMRQLTALGQDRAWTLFRLLANVGYCGAFFVSFMAATIIIGLAKLV